jgi:hypothetical protein
MDTLERALEFVKMTLPDAQAARWEDGRSRYGDAWKGHPPLLEAYVELIDLRNYLSEAERQGAIGSSTANLLADSTDLLAAVLLSTVREQFGVLIKAQE